MYRDNEKILKKIAMKMKEKMIECFYSDFKLQDVEKFDTKYGEFHSKWYEDDCDMMCQITDFKGELIGFIRHYRFRMWIEYGEGIVKEIPLCDPIVTIVQ